MALRCIHVKDSLKSSMCDGTSLYRAVAASEPFPRQHRALFGQTTNIGFVTTATLENSKFNKED